MPITLLINGIKTKVENKVVEAAFAQAVTEAPAEQGLLVGLGNAAVSKIAADMGFARTEPLGHLGADVRCFPGALIARVGEILGTDLVSKVWSDPATEARPETVAPIVESRLGCRLDLRSDKYRIVKTWVALVTARDKDGRYGRSFLPDQSDSDSGRRDHTYYLVDGLYQIQDVAPQSSISRRYFLLVENWVAREIDQVTADSMIPMSDEPIDYSK